MVASAMRSLSQNSEFNFHNHAFHYEYSEVSASIAADFDVLPFRAEPDHLPKIIKLVKNNELQVMMLWSDEEAIASSKVRDNLIRAAGLKVPEYTVKSELSDFYHSLKFHGYPQRTVVLKPVAGSGERGVSVLLGDDGSPNWLGTGRREKRVSALNKDDMEFGSTKYLVMQCLHALVYDVDVVRLNDFVPNCLVRERNNSTGIPYTGNVLRQNDEIQECAENIESIMNLRSLHDIDIMTDPVLGPVFMEINPLPDGSLAALSSAGYRLLDYALAAAASILIVIDEVQVDTRIVTYSESVAFS